MAPETVKELLHLNIGPAHPTTHGTLRLACLLDGETIEKTELEIGYLHRCFEKLAENRTYNQVIMYTDRLNYCSPQMNNTAYCMAVEKLLGVEIPKRAQYLRVIACELSRIMDHVVCLGANSIEMGALTNFWYLFQHRETIYDFFEEWTGTRLTTSFTRVGGCWRDMTPELANKIRAFLDVAPKIFDEVESLLINNRIFLDRTKNVGAISGERALAWGWTGPCLRACGVNRDLRKLNPIYDYDKFQFEVPLGKNGDTFDRFYVRLQEMRESLKIVRQALDGLPSGDFILRDNRYVLPEKEKVYNTVEGLINHSKLIYEGLRPPAGEVYECIEAANGELGFYIVSDGTGKPYRVKCRPPCFAIYQAFPELVKGHMIADLIAILGSLNIIAGELDR